MKDSNEAFEIALCDVVTFDSFHCKQIRYWWMVLIRIILTGLPCIVQMAVYVATVHM